MGVWINLPGFATFVNYGTAKTLTGWSELYDISYPLGLTISVLVYMLLNKLAPVRGIGEVDDLDYFGTFGPAVTEGQSVEEEDVEAVYGGTAGLKGIEMEKRG